MDLVAAKSVRECSSSGAATIPILEPVDVLDPMDVNSGKPVAPFDVLFDLAGQPWSIGLLDVMISC